MANIAEIGFKADTKDLVTVKRDLDAIPPSAQKVEQAANNLQNELKKTNGAFGDVASGANNAGKAFSIAKVAGGVFAGAILGIGLAARNAYGDLLKLESVANKTGSSFENLQKSQFAAASLGGLGGSDFFKGIEALGQTANENFREGEGKLKQLFEANNLSITDRAGKLKNVNELLFDASSLIKNANTEFDKIELVKTLGLSNEWVKVLEKGPNAIKNARNEAIAAGVVIEDSLIKKAADFDSAWSKTTEVFSLNFKAGLASLYTSVVEFLPRLQEIATAIAIAFSPVIIAGFVAVVGSLTFAIAGGLVSAIGAAASAMVAFSLANPFTAILLAVTTTVAAVYYFRDEISKALGFDIVEVAKSGANFIINSFVGGYDYIIAVWNNLPQAVGGAALGAANATISAISKMVNAAIEGINSMISAIPAWLGGSNDAIKFRMDENSRFVNDFANRSQDAMTKARESFDKTLGTDRFAGFTRSVNTANEALAKFRQSELQSQNESFAKTVIPSGKSGDNNTGVAEKELTDLQKIAEGYKLLSEPFNQANTAFSAAKTALENNLITNEEYLNSIGKIKDAFLEAGGTSDQWAKLVTKNADDASSAMDKFAEKSLKKVGDEFVDMAFKGKINFADLAKSIVKDLVKIMVQAMIVKPLLGLFGGFKFWGDGGAFGSPAVEAAANGAAFGGKTGVSMFAGGGTFTNSVVNKPTPFTFANGGALGVMGEAGPEAIMPLKRGSDGSLGVQMHQGKTKSSPIKNNVTVSNNYTISGAISSEQIIASIRASAEQTLEDAKKSLVGHLDQYNRDGYL